MTDAITFPVPLADMDVLQIDSVRFELQEGLQQSRARGGGQIRGSVADPIWRATVTLADCGPREAAERDALLDVLRGPGAEFHLCHPLIEAPARDPDGAVLGAAAVTIGAIDADGKRLTLSGLPANYILTRGDLLSYAHGADRRALHRVVTAQAHADASGNLQIEVRPHVPATAVAGAAVQLVRPFCIAQIEAGSAKRDTDVLRKSGGAQFTALQVRP